MIGLSSLLGVGVAPEFGVSSSWGAMPIEWDPQLSIGEVATSLALIGAALGYLINLVVKHREDRSRRKYRGTRLVIVDLFETAYPRSLIDREIWDKYKSDETKSIRSLYAAWPPDKFSEFREFDGELRQLQLDRLIVPTGPSRYRLHVEEDAWDLQKLSELQVAKRVTELADVSQLIDLAKKAFDDKHLRYDATEILVSINSDQAWDILKEIINSDDLEASMSVATRVALAMRTLNDSLPDVSVDARNSQGQSE